MKKILLLWICLLAMQISWSQNRKIIQFSELPVQAQQFINKNFPKTKVLQTRMGKKWYEVQFSNGDKIEFNDKGDWKDLKCKKSFVPESVVPKKILSYIKEHYPSAKIERLEKDRYEYEVKLTNRWELKFDTAFNLTDVDHNDD